MSKSTGISPQQTLDFMYKILQQETMETMSKNAGTKVIFVEKNGQTNFRDDLIQAMEAHDFKKDEDLKR